MIDVCSQKIFAALVALVGVALSAPIYPVPLHYVALTPIPENIYNQVQDTKSGEYAFGYAGGPVAREEAKTSDGVIRGAYSYIDAYGIVQHYRYIADDDGFRIIGTNVPTEAAPNGQFQLQEQPKIDAENSSDEPEEHFSSRRKRSVLYHAIESVETIPAVPLTLAAVASVPIATSSQNRVQIHNNLKAKISYPAETIAGEAAATLPKVEFAVKNADEIPTVVAASLPTSTSSQFRHQIHNSVKTEFHTPVQAIPTETIAAVPVASVAIPIELKNVEAIPVAVAASVPTSTSSQSRYQVHNSQKTELYSSGVPVEAIAAVPATLLNTKSPEAASVAVAATVPISTSSQSRFQVHNNVKTEILEPVETIPIQTVAPVPAAPIAVSSTLKNADVLPVAASLPTSTSSQSRFQIHSSERTEIHAPVQEISLRTVATIPATQFAVAPIAISSQQRFQSHDSSEALSALTSDRLISQANGNARLEYGKLSQSSKFELAGLEPVNGLRLANAFSEPSLAHRHQIGVGLGVVPSPLVAYHTFESPLYS